MEKEDVCNFYKNRTTPYLIKIKQPDGEVVTYIKSDHPLSGDEDLENNIWHCFDIAFDENGTPFVRVDGTSWASYPNAECEVEWEITNEDANKKFGKQLDFYGMSDEEIDEYFEVLQELKK